MRKFNNTEGVFMQKKLIFYAFLFTTSIKAGEAMEVIDESSEHVPSISQSNTKLLYLYDTYNGEHSSKIIRKGSDQKKGNFFILDETIFYPQGGGQPSDTGVFVINDKSYNVSFASSVEGVVHHYIEGDISNVEVGQVALLKINMEKRLLHAKIHTGGHLLEGVLEKFAPELVGFKGYHFPEGPSVEFKGKLTSLSNTQLIEQVNLSLKEMILKKHDVIVKEVDLEGLKKLCGNSDVPLNDNTARIVTIDKFKPIPCGGTHIKNLSELKSVSIRKVQNNKGNTKISYIAN